MLYVVSGAPMDVTRKAVSPLVGGGNKIVVLSRVEEYPPQKGDVFLFLGNKGIDWLASRGMIPKNRKVPSMRQRPIPYQDAFVMVSHDPFVAAGDYSYGIEVNIDCVMADRLHRTGTCDPKIGDYTWVSSFAGVVAEIEKEHQRSGQKVDVTLDLETVGLDEFKEDAWIVSVSVSWKKGVSRLMYFSGRHEYPDKEEMARLEWILTSDIISMKGANLKYDLRWMWQHWGLRCTNFKMDTTLVGSLLDENRSNGLETHTWMYTQMGGYDREMNQNYDKGKMHEIPKETLLTYAGGDTDACLQVAEAQKKDLLRDPKLANFYVKLLHPSSRVFERMEQVGLPVDLEAYTSLQNDLEIEIATVQLAAEALMSGRLKAKHKGNLKLSRSAVLADWMFSPLGLGLKPIDFTEKSKAPSTSLDHLNKFLAVPEAAEVVGLIRRYNKATKMLGTYVHGFLSHLRSDGRFHASYMLFKSDDGGTNCMPAGELVLTNRGYLPVEDVVVGDLVISHMGVIRAVTDTMENGVKPVIRVTLANGCSLITTLNHQYRTAKGWIEAGSLHYGDKVYTHSAGEVWRPVVNWPYEVSSWGRVRRVGGEPLTQYRKGKWGHLKVCFSRYGEQSRGHDRRDFTVHRLVAEAFHGTGVEVRHLNGIAWDNTVDNLCWGTSKQNKEDAVAHGSMSRRDGTQNKLTDEKVAYIRATSREEKNNAQLAKELGVSRELVRDVRNNKRWTEKEHPGKIVKFSLSEVVTVEILSERMTYGITVGVDHSHVTGGIVTHNTGRLSCRDPALQTLPKHDKVWAPKFRNCFPCFPGYTWVPVDYSQGELRVAADIANERTMLEMYANNVDLHLIAGARALGISPEEAMSLVDDQKIIDPNGQYQTKKTIRQNGKASNFGFLYGMQAMGYVTYARDTYGVIVSEQQAGMQREAFFNLFPRLLGWHAESVELARRTGMIRTPLGRVRHLPMINSRDWGLKSQEERRSINAPVQATLSDLTQFAGVMVEKEYGVRDDVFPVTMTHDELVFAVKTDQLSVWVPRLVDVFENLPLGETFGWYPKVKFVAEPEYGDRLGTLSPWKG